MIDNVGPKMMIFKVVYRELAVCTRKRRRNKDRFLMVKKILKRIQEIYIYILHITLYILNIYAILNPGKAMNRVNQGASQNPATEIMGHKSK